jgi:hypothetical protein
MNLLGDFCIGLQARKSFKSAEMNVCKKSIQPRKIGEKASLMLNQETNNLISTRKALFHGDCHKSESAPFLTWSDLKWQAHQLINTMPLEIPVIDEQTKIRLLKQKEFQLETGILGAVIKGDRDEVKALIGAKANIETRDEVTTRTPLKENRDVRLPRQREPIR